MPSFDLHALDCTLFECWENGLATVVRVKYRTHWVLCEDEMRFDDLFCNLIDAIIFFWVMFFHPALQLTSGKENLVPACQANQPNIRTKSHHLPVEAPAWMGFA